jgi:hypothetical protein
MLKTKYRPFSFLWSGCETQFLTLRGKHRRTIFGPKEMK